MLVMIYFHRRLYNKHTFLFCPMWIIPESSQLSAQTLLKDLMQASNYFTTDFNALLAFKSPIILKAISYIRPKTVGLLHMEYWGIFVTLHVITGSLPSVN